MARQPPSFSIFHLLTSPQFFLLVAIISRLVGKAHLSSDLIGISSLFLVIFLYLELTPSTIYLVDFACYRPPKELKISKKEFIDLAKKSGSFNAEAIEFQKKIIENSGIGDESYLPRSVFAQEDKIQLRWSISLSPYDTVETAYKLNFRPGRATILRDGREEAALVMFGAVDDLIASTGIRPREIKILVVNCSVLNTTPSLSAMIVNHYKLRKDVISFNLGGMGCAAVAAAVDLAKDLLEAHPGSLALVVSTEIVSATWYRGNELDMLLPNCFFRMGAAALLLSSRRRDWWRAKYQLDQQVVRTHMGNDDRSFGCVRLKEDDEGKQGVAVSNNHVQVCGEAAEKNIQALKGKRGVEDVEHVCITAAGKMVLDEVQRKLGLKEMRMEASRRTLERFGDTSSSSVWYELAYLEAQEKVMEGDRVLQVSFGSGFKCGSIVWKSLRRPRRPLRSPWLEEREK